jgi:N utilization substance protein B
VAVKSRRKAREAALRALYEVEVGHTAPVEAAQAAATEVNLNPELTAYTVRVVVGVRNMLGQIDNGLARLIRDYDYDRIAAIDRNLLRLAAYELLEEANIPPAVTINEAVTIAKKYSTLESGRFVNGVLAKYLLDTPKANWRGTESPEYAEPDAAEEVEVEEEVVEEGSDEAAMARKFGAWTVRGGPAS